MICVPPLKKMKKVIKAVDLAPKAFQPVVDVADKEDDLIYDLGNLCAYDVHPLHSASVLADKEAYLQATARDNAQLLVNHVFQLPVERDPSVGAVALLPSPTTPVPREKPVPEAKPLTKWEKFAKEKGIKNTKKSRKVYDEEVKDFVPAFGYKSKSDMSDWLIPVKQGQDPYEDPFLKAKLAKQKNVVDNRVAQVKNIDRAAKKGGGSKRGEDRSSDALLGIPEVNETKLKGKHTTKGVVKFGKGKEGTKRLIQDVGVSTASMGRFDAVVAGEGERSKVKSKRRRYDDNISSLKSERSRDMGVLASLVGGDEGSKIRRSTASKEDDSGRERKKRRV